SLKSTFDYIEGMIGKSLPVEFEKEYRKNTFKAFKTDLKPVNGVHDLLNRITLPYCVASSGPLEKIKLNLKTTNLIEKFENKIFSSYEIGSWKPDPGIFLFAAKKMGYKPNQCVVIEDSMAGIKAAKAGGFDVYALVKNRNENVLENTGVNVFYDMNNLDSLLNI
ncbi:MAG: HAD-IA family hydrolase, partial [Cyclobacteriaceae bacterium]|nr:HAD-IA family hydrolase [Cyclobacteriaceae bacterium]MCK5278519.1 HAD-IA family hydrolase [Cyclobacteriaceae bacterium]